MKPQLKTRTYVIAMLFVPLAVAGCLSAAWLALLIFGKPETLFEFGFGEYSYLKSAFLVIFVVFVHEFLHFLAMIDRSKFSFFVDYFGVGWKLNGRIKKWSYIVFSQAPYLFLSILLPFTAVALFCAGKISGELLLHAMNAALLNAVMSCFDIYSAIGIAIEFRGKRFIASDSSGYAMPCD